MSYLSAHQSLLSRSVLGLLVAGAMALPLAHASDENLADIIASCAEAARLLEANDVDGALDEAEWCREGIQQVKQNQTMAIFPDSVNGYTGGEVTKESALGMVMLGRQYTQADKSIDVELMSGSAGGGLGGLSQLISAFGAAGGAEGKKFRVQSRTVIDSSSGGSAEMMVQLKSGGMMNVKSTSASRDEVEAFIRDFPVADLDDALSN
jgi:hypothetical protein